MRILILLALLSLSFTQHNRFPTKRETEHIAPRLAQFQHDAVGAPQRTYKGLRPEAPQPQVLVQDSDQFEDSEDDENLPSPLARKGRFVQMRQDDGSGTTPVIITDDTGSVPIPEPETVPEPESTVSSDEFDAVIDDEVDEEEDNGPGIAHNKSGRRGRFVQVKAEVDPAYEDAAAAVEAENQAEGDVQPAVEPTPEPVQDPIEPAQEEVPQPVPEEVAQPEESTVSEVSVSEESGEEAQPQQRIIHGGGGRNGRFAQLPAPKKFNIYKLPRHESSDNSFDEY